MRLEKYNPNLICSSARSVHQKTLPLKRASLRTLVLDERITRNLQIVGQIIKKDSVCIKVAIMKLPFINHNEATLSEL
jgi:hypothetical protein